MPPAVTITPLLPEQANIAALRAISSVSRTLTGVSSTPGDCATDRGLEITPRGFGDACEVGGGEIVQDRSGPLRGLVDIGVAADSCDLP